MIGIYAYIDKYNGEIVYIGKDSNIDNNRRYYAHKSKSCYNTQRFNRILQNNLERYDYKILKRWDKYKYNKNLANVLEILYIKKYNPKFNFTIGGEGRYGLTPWNKGKKLTEEHKSKLSENHYHCKKEKNPSWKDYARIKKAGKQSNKNQTQRYAIVRKGEIIKRSVDIGYLIKWFKEQYPQEQLKVIN